MKTVHSWRRMVITLAAFLVLTAGAKSAPDESAEEHLGKGYDALKQDRYAEAEGEFRAALRLDPSLVMRARFPLAVALFEMKESSEARKEFEAVRKETGDHPNVMYYLGRLDLMDQNFVAAIRNLSKAAANPPFPDTAYHLGFAYFKQGDLTNAEKWLKLAAQLNPRDSVPPYQLALVYRKEGREEEAKEVLARSADLRQRNADDSQLKLECAKKLDQGPRDEARAVCQRLYDPNDAEKLTALGTIYGQHGDLEAALEPLLRATQLAPQSPQMQYNLAFTYYQMNRLEEARIPLANAIQRWPDLFQLNALYGAVLRRLGEDLPAYQALHRAHQLNKQDPGTANLLYTTTLAIARKNQSTGQYADSLHYFEEAAVLRPNDPEPHRGLAEVYAATGRLREAATEQQRVAELVKSPGIAQ